ncbi:hypothetical protein [Prevotella falsenii]|uniref:hypothetical protein n=1 Tax=Prevotella falsenii TaxID=515414 RepID=UPI000467F6C5|nr:hypothetical protein [Prevotella falsenii]
MATHPSWSEEYWLLLLQIYLKKPIGTKRTYARPMVELSLELHIPPHMLFEKMEQLAEKDTQSLKALWETYAKNPNKLRKEAKRIRGMKGFGKPEKFYEGVEASETFEKDFLPIEKATDLTPAALIVVLDLYFRLTPITMVEETPEVKEVARLLDISAHRVVEIMEVYRFCDPYLNHDDLMISPLLLPCRNIWDRYGNADTKKLSTLAQELHHYFR